MAQRKGKLQRYPRFHLPRGAALLLLCVFLCARGLVPAGYMPAPVAGGAPYDLCHGDSRSAQLLQWLAAREHHQHTASHQHDALTAQVFADNHCSFAASAVAAAAAAAEMPVITTGAHPALSFGASAPPARRDYLQPPSRAPPAFPFS